MDRVVRHEWQHNFADARNVSLDAAANDWVFVLDCDETLAPGSIEPLLRLPGSGPANAYIVRRLERGCGAGAEMRFVRLGNRVGRRFVGRIHEQIVPPFERVEQSDVVIVHHSDSLSPDPAKRARYADLLERQLSETPDHNYYLMDLAHLYLASGNPRAADLMLRAVTTLDRQSLRAPHALVSVLLEVVLRQPPNVFGMSGREAEQLADRWFPDHPPLLSVRARVALAAGDYRRCIELGRRALDLWASGQQQTAIAYPEDAVRADIQLNLGVAYTGLGDLPASLACFEQARRFPGTAQAASQNIDRVRRAALAAAASSAASSAETSRPSQEGT